MTFETRFKEIYISLADNELVCTIRYGGLPGKRRRFPLEVKTTRDVNFEDQEPSVVRTRSRFGHPVKP